MASSRRNALLIAALCIQLGFQLAYAQVKIKASGVIQIYPSDVEGATGWDYFLKPKTSSVGGPSINANSLWYLTFANAVTPEGLLSGQSVEAVGFMRGASWFYVVSLNVTQGVPPQDFFYGAPSVTVTSISFLVSLCNQKAIPNTTALRGMWTRQGAQQARTNPDDTIEALYNECSWGKVQFPAANNLIVDLQHLTPPAAVSSQIPCTGNTMTCSGRVAGLHNGVCNYVRLAWLQWAMDYAVQTLGIDLNQYARKLLVIPLLGVFQASGMAQVGAGIDVPTVMYIQGPYTVYSLRPGFHELGHNYGLQHSYALNAAGVPEDYADLSCGMGSVVRGNISPRCMNAPQAWYAGWAEAVADVNDTNFSPGQWQTHVLPAYLSNKKNLVRVVPTWLSPVNGSIGGPSYFFSYRQAIGRDALLDRMYLGSVSVHIYNGTRSIVSRAYPVMQQQLSQGASLDVSSIDVVVKVTSTAATTATIKLCRYTQTTETDCNNGLDDDCDGLIDIEDPDCPGARPPPSHAPPSPSPSPFPSPPRPRPTPRPRPPSPKPPVPPRPPSLPPPDAPADPPFDFAPLAPPNPPPPRPLRSPRPPSPPKPPPRPSPKSSPPSPKPPRPPAPKPPSSPPSPKPPRPPVPKPPPPPPSPKPPRPPSPKPPRPPALKPPPSPPSPKPPRPPAPKPLSPPPAPKPSPSPSPKPPSTLKPPLPSSPRPPRPPPRPLPSPHGAQNRKPPPSPPPKQHRNRPPGPPRPPRPPPRAQRHT